MAGEDWLHEPRPHIPTPPTIKTFRFRDLNPDYTLNHKDVVLLDIEATNARIRHILSTILGSEDFEPRYGSNLPLRLYDTISDVTAFLLEGDTIVALNTWMSDEITVSAAAAIEPLENEDGYRINIPYVLKKSNTPTVYSFDALR